MTQVISQGRKFLVFPMIHFGAVEKPAFCLSPDAGRIYVFLDGA
jgi:hypothetical protein